MHNQRQVIVTDDATHSSCVLGLAVLNSPPEVFNVEGSGFLGYLLQQHQSHQILCNKPTSFHCIHPVQLKHCQITHLRSLLLQLPLRLTKLCFLGRESLVCALRGLYTARECTVRTLDMPSPKHHNHHKQGKTNPNPHHITSHQHLRAHSIRSEQKTVLPTQHPLRPREGGGSTRDWAAAKTHCFGRVARREKVRRAVASGHLRSVQAPNV